MNRVPFLLELVAILAILVGLYFRFTVHPRRPVDPCVIYSLGGSDDCCQLSGGCASCRSAALFERRRAVYLMYQKQKVGLDGPCAECRHREHDAMECRSCLKLWAYTDPECPRLLGKTVPESQL